jgi:AcrR family transcriptional regulator
VGIERNRKGGIGPSLNTGVAAMVRPEGKSGGMSDSPMGADAAPATGDTRERILHAAHDLFARGFARVSMRQVARAAGVTKPAVYYHFRNKESLFEECLTDFNDELQATMRRAVRHRGSSDERVRAVAETLLSGSPYHPVRVHDELVEEGSGPLRERLRSTFSTVVVAPVVDLFADLEARGDLRPGVEPADAASVLIGACMALLPRAGSGDDAWTPLPAPSGQPLPPDQAAAMVTDMVLRGVGAAPWANRR